MPNAIDTLKSNLKQQSFSENSERSKRADARRKKMGDAESLSVSSLSISDEVTGSEASTSALGKRQKYILKYKAWVHIGFKCPSKNTINTKLAGWNQDVLPVIYFTVERDRVIPSIDTVHCPRMPHVNQPISSFSFEKFWPSRDLNPGPSTFAADALPTELLDWADWLMSNLRWHDGSGPYDLQLPSMSLLTCNTQPHQDVHG